MMKQQLPNPRRRGIETLIHIIVWGIVIGFPFLMMTDVYKRQDQNRRVEVYMYASEQMIKNAEAAN